VIPLLFFIALAIPVNAYTKGNSNLNVTYYLIKDPIAGVKYTPYCFVECHLPINFSYSGSTASASKSFSLSDLAYLKNNLVGKDNLESISLKYLANETYSLGTWIPNNTCENVTPIETNKSYLDCSDKGYYVYSPSWRYVWKDVPSSITLQKDKFYAVDIIAKFTPSLGFSAVDIVPSIYTFQMPELAWWNSSFQYRTNFTFPSYVSSALSNYPVYLIINTSGFIASGKMRSDCNDIRFTNSSGSLLNFEIVNKADGSFGCNTNQTEIWINVPSFASSNTTNVISMYYGYSSSENGDNPTNVWNSNYHGIWHFDSTAPHDSTSYINNLTTHGSPTLVNGKIGQGVQMVTDGSDYLYASGSTGLDFTINETLEVWVKRSSASSASVTLARTGTGANGEYARFNSDNSLFWEANIGGNFYSITSAKTEYSSTTSYYYLVYTFKGVGAGTSEMRLYVNGTQTDTNLNAYTPLNNSFAWYFGARQRDLTTATFKGVMDEVRMSNATLSADWIKQSYESINSYAGITNTSEESTSGGNPPLWSNPVNSTVSSYSPSTKSTFNITWINGSASLIVNTTRVNLTSNFTGSFVNYGMTLISGDGFSGVYGFDLIVPAGTFIWNSTAPNNGTSPQSNTSNSITVKINQFSSSCSLGLDPASPTQYGNLTTATCSCSNPEGTVKLYRNNVDKTAENNTAITLGYGTYSYVCNVTNTNNYTTSTASQSYVINQATPNINITTNASNPVTAGTIVNLTCNYPSQLSINFYNDTSSISNPFIFNTTGLTGTYNFTCNTTGNTNYTSGSGSYSLVIIPIGGLSIDAVYDEKTLTPLTFNVTIYNSSYSQTTNNINSYSNNSVKGSLTVSISKSGYIPRNYYIYVPIVGSYNFSGYLLQTTDGVYVSYWGYSTLYPTGEPLALIQVYRFLNSSWTDVAESKSDVEGKGTLFLDPYTTYIINAQTADGSLIYNLSSYSANPSFILKLIFGGLAGGTNISWLFTGVNYSLTPLDIYLRSNITTFNYTISAANSDIDWYALRLIYQNGTVLYFSNQTNSSGGSITVNLNYTSLSGYVTAQTFLKRSGFDLYSWNRTFIIWATQSAIPDALNYLKNSSGLPVVILSLISLFCSFGIASISNRVVRTGSGIIYLIVLTIFGLFGLFGSDVTATWTILTGLYLMEVGILLYREVW
jgi:hypothetical protein